MFYRFRKGVVTLLGALDVFFRTVARCVLFVRPRHRERKIYTISLPSGPEFGSSPNEWNGLGYTAMACLQFNWGSSLGAPPVPDKDGTWFSAL